MENKILEFVNNNDTWKQFKETYKLLQQKEEYFCTFSDDMKNIQNDDVNIIRFLLNNKYEAKINIINNDDIKLHYDVDLFNNKWIVKAPFYVKISNVNPGIIEEIVNNLNITKIYKNHQIDYHDYAKFTGFNNVIIGNVAIKDIETLDSFIIKMTELFNKLLIKCE